MEKTVKEINQELVQAKKDILTVVRPVIWQLQKNIDLPITRIDINMLDVTNCEDPRMKTTPGNVSIQVNWEDGYE